MIRPALLSALLLPLLLALPCGAEPPEDPAEALTYLTDEFKPYNFREDGKATGLAVELLRLMWKEMGVKEQPIQFVPWPRAYQMARDEPGMVIFTMLQTPKRLDAFKWVGPIAHSETYLWAKKDSPIQLRSINDAKGLTIGVVKEYASAQLIQPHASIVKIDSLSSMEIVIKKLDSDRIHLLSAEERSFYRKLKDMDKSPEAYKKVLLFNQARSYFGFSLSTPDALVARFQDACDKVRGTRRFQQLQNFYLSRQ